MARFYGPDDDVFGWGVLVVEGPNSTAITWLGALMLTVSAAVSIVYTVVSKDASAWFAIGGFLTSVWVAWMTVTQEKMVGLCLQQVATKWAQHCFNGLAFRVITSWMYFQI
jgi:hypothetical protein